MPLVLRIDVDKSYGRSNLLQKIVSKIAENYWIPSISPLGYLHDLKKFLIYLNMESIKAHIYFRRCTLPPPDWFQNGLLGGHKLGLHAEDTRDFETFKKEFTDVQKYFNLVELTSFTKHGSGNWKSGRNHYPPYEPEKYLEWAELLGIPFLFGNKEDINEPCQSNGQNQFYSSAFWLDRPYTDYGQSSLQNVIDIAKVRNIVLLIHCADFVADERVAQGMRDLVSMAQEQGVSWITL